MRGSTQVKFNEGFDWLCGRPLPRDAMTPLPFVGEVSGVTPSFCYEEAEVRRRDVGTQQYGNGTPKMNSAAVDRNNLLVKEATQTEMFSTSQGLIALPTSRANCGFLPTADTVLFLKDQYEGTRTLIPPLKYFPQ